MNLALIQSAVTLIIAITLPACMTSPTRETLLNQEIIYSRSSDKNYLEIAKCLNTEDGFHTPKWHRHTWRDINTFFIYHEAVEVHGYPQMHDEAAKTYYITEIHDPKFIGNTNQPITEGNGLWIMTIKDNGNEEYVKSKIEIRSSKNLLSDYPPVSYTPDPRAPLSQRLYKVETIDKCF